MCIVKQRLVCVKKIATGAVQQNGRYLKKNTISEALVELKMLFNWFKTFVNDSRAN